MERQRNKPVKYNRELVHKSVKAMQKVEEVCKALTRYMATLISIINFISPPLFQVLCLYSDMCLSTDTSCMPTL